MLAGPFGGQVAEARVTPIPCGRRPSMAALTRSGARKASEIVMLILRTLQPSRAEPIRPQSRLATVYPLCSQKPTRPQLL